MFTLVITWPDNTVTEEEYKDESETRRRVSQFQRKEVKVRNWQLFDKDDYLIDEG